jgi:hypothetical protein
MSVAVCPIFFGQREEENTVTVAFLLLQARQFTFAAMPPCFLARFLFKFRREKFSEILV